MTEPYIGTYTNKKFYFLDPKPEQICIQDIAQALSMSCRFSGHVSKFYSVAEHCCIIADLVERYHDNKNGILRDAVIPTKNKHAEAKAALLHDASEAYICDIPRPIKPHLDNYFDMELKIEKVIQEKYNITAKTDLINYYDHHICGEEARQLFLHVPDWVEDFDRIDGIKINAWTPDQAKKEFLDRFYRLNYYANIETPEEKEWFDSIAKSA